MTASLDISLLDRFLAICVPAGGAQKRFSHFSRWLAMCMSVTRFSSATSFTIVALSGEVYALLSRGLSNVEVTQTRLFVLCFHLCLTMHEAP